MKLETALTLKRGTRLKAIVSLSCVEITKGEIYVMQGDATPLRNLSQEVVEACLPIITDFDVQRCLLYTSFEVVE